MKLFLEILLFKVVISVIFDTIDVNLRCMTLVKFLVDVKRQK